MSRERALKTIRLEPTDRVAQHETFDHPGLMAELVDYDPWDNPQQAFVDSYRALDLDWVTAVPKRAVRFGAHESSKQLSDGVRVTEWGLTGSSWSEEFAATDIDGVLDFDPEAEIDIPTDPCQDIRADQELVGDSTLIVGIYYTTLFMHPIMRFGWELFLQAAAAEPDRFQRVLEGFAEVSRRTLEGWSKNPPPLILIHDDIAMEEGMVFHPDWYRKRLFPLYERLLEPVWGLPDTKVAFVSDGDYTPVLPDLVSMGFDGFIINDNMDMRTIARDIGQDHFLAGIVRTQVLTLGTREDVVEEVKRCLEDAEPCAGHFIKATRDLPHNIPIENLRTYFQAVNDLGAR